MIFQFGSYRLDIERRQLCAANVPLDLEPRVYQILLYLVQHRERVVTKDELLDHVWPQVYVDDKAVARCMTTLRKVLGDDRYHQHIIRTRRGFGYQFVMSVKIVAADVPSGQSSVSGVEPAAEVPGAAVKTDTSISHSQHVPSTPQCLSAVDTVRPAAERKVVTVLCGVFANTLGVDLELDVQHEIFTALQTFVRQVADPYNGLSHYVSLDCAEIVFGAPVTLEDHAALAVLAARTMLQQWPDFLKQAGLPAAQGCPLRIGIYSGSVAISGTAGDATHPLSLVGDTVTITAQVARQAGDNRILATTATVSLLQLPSALEALTPVVLEQRTGPLDVYDLTHAANPQSGPRAASERFRSPFVGRRSELTALHARFEEVQDGQGQVVGIVGEPGMGKSRLLVEFQNAVRDTPVSYLTAHCRSYGAATPYLPLIALLRQQCRLGADDDPQASANAVRQTVQTLGLEVAWVPYLCLLLGLPGHADLPSDMTPQVRRSRTFESVHQLFLQSGRQRPLVLQVEDLHWIDPTSEAYLASLVERFSGVPILLLVSYRPGYQAPWLTTSYATQMALRPLSARDSGRMIRNRLRRRRVSPGIQQHIATIADGNPLFLEELTQAMAERDVGDAALPIPDAIQGVLSARIDRLPADAKRLLQTAAVIGREVPATLLQTVAALPPDTFHQQLRHLQSAEFLYESALVPESIYTFKHALTHEVAYQSLLRRPRQTLHQRIAAALAANTPERNAEYPERLARHYTAGAQFEQAVAWWQRAGQLAIARTAYVEAIQHFNQGLTLLDELPHTPQRMRTQLAFHIDLGPALMATCGYAADDVERNYRRAYALCQQVGDNSQLSVVLKGLKGVYQVRADYRTAREMSAEMRRLAQRTGDQDGKLWSFYSLGEACFFLGDFCLARDYFEQGVSHYDANPSPTLVGVIRDHGVGCLAYLPLVYWSLGYPEQARRISDACLARAEALSHPYTTAVAHNYAASFHLLQRGYQTGLYHAEQLIALATEYQWPIWIAAGTMYRGSALGLLGQPATGIAQIEAGLKRFEATGAAMSLTTFLTFLTEIHLHQRHLSDGLRVLDRALAHVNRHDEGHRKAELHRLHGEPLIAQYRNTQRAPLLDEAEACLLHALAVARQQQAISFELRSAISLSQLLRQHGRQVEAHALLSEIYGHFTEGFDTPDLQDARKLLQTLA